MSLCHIIPSNESRGWPYYQCTADTPTRQRECGAYYGHDFIGYCIDNSNDDHCSSLSAQPEHVGKRLSR